MRQQDFEIEELEERIAPSSVAFGAQQPAADSSAASLAGEPADPQHWHPLWPVDPWPPVA